MSNSDKMSLREIAKRLGRSNLSDYRAKYDDFPDPVEEVNARRKYWSEQEVRDWFASKGLHVRRSRG